MLGRPCITTITPHQFTPQLATSPSSSSSPSRCVMPLSFSHRFPLVWSVIVSCVMLLLTCVGVPSLVSAQDCTLQVPANPLSIGGLATPWVLSGAGCSQANVNSMTFVQGAVIDLKTGAISIYNPLVVDLGKPAFAAPVIPKINQMDGFVLAYWIQTHAKSITLIDNGTGALQQANCTNGLPASKFGKFAFCNAWAFYVNAKLQTAAGNIVPAPLGTGSLDGQPCPSIRDYSFIGRDTQMTVMTSYLLNVGTGLTAHNTPANNLACNGACIVIQSDSARLLSNIEATIGCALWVRPDLTDANMQQQASALPLNQIQAAVFTVASDPNTVALVPANDILAIDNNGVPNLQKLNLIRDALNQPEVPNLGAANTAQYCMAMTMIPPPRLANDAGLMRAFQRQGDTNEAANLYTLVVKRQIELYTNLGCPTVLAAPAPFTVVPADWNVNSPVALQDATPIQPVVMGPLRCQNMFIFDTKCSFLICLLVVGGGIIAGCVGIFILRVLQAWKYGDRTKQDSTRGAIRV